MTISQIILALDDESLEVRVPLKLEYYQIEIYMVEKNLSVLESPVSVRLHRALCKVRDHAGMFSVLYTIPSPSQGLAADYLHTSCLSKCELWIWKMRFCKRCDFHMSERRLRI